MGIPIAELIHQVGISEQSFYRWKKKYSGLEVDQVRQMKQLQEENTRLKRILADLTLDKAMLEAVLTKKSRALAVPSGGEVSECELPDQRSARLHRGTFRYCGSKGPRTELRMRVREIAQTRVRYKLVATQGGIGNDPLYVSDTRDDKVIRSIPGFGVGSQVIATGNGATVFVPPDAGLKIARNYLTAWPDIDTMALTEISAMALTLDERVLIVGITAGYEDRAFAGLVSIALQTDKLCPNIPTPLEAAPPVIAIARDGVLVIAMPNRVLTGDSLAL